MGPAFYGGTDHPAIYGIDDERDFFEVALVKQAAGRRLPVLAICRGMQVLNVALGGSLIEDVPSEVGDSVKHFVPGEAARTPHQYVSLQEGSRLSRILGASQMQVNSIHHQAVRSPAPGLRPVAWSDDGVIEALEPDQPDWPLLAVQWHPEHLVHDQASARRLFNSLVMAADVYRQTRAAAVAQPSR